MCTLSIDIDANTVRRINPNLTSHVSFGLKVSVADRLRLMESGEAIYVDGAEGFAQIQKRYGL